MNGRTLLPALALAFGAFAVSGCSNGQPRLKGLDAYANATMTNDYVPVDGIDPYSYGGTAYASGGTKPGVSYGTGAEGDMDGDAKHFRDIAGYNGANWPVDWGTGYLDSSGIVVPQPPKPIQE